MARSDAFTKLASAIDNGELNNPAAALWKSRALAAEARVAEFQAQDLDDLGTLTHAARRLGVERCEHTLGSLIGLLEARVAELEEESQPMGMLEANMWKVEHGQLTARVAELETMGDAVAESYQAEQRVSAGLREVLIERDARVSVLEAELKWHRELMAGKPDQRGEEGS